MPVRLARDSCSFSIKAIRTKRTSSKGAAKRQDLSQHKPQSGQRQAPGTFLRGVASATDGRGGSGTFRIIVFGRVRGFEHPPEESLKNPLARPSSMSEETMQIDWKDHLIAVRRLGRGPAVVLLHGYPLDGALWSGVARSP